MPLWQKLASYWVATNPEIAESQVAKSNLPLAKAIADKIRAVLVDEEQGLGLKLNTGKDLPSTGVQQQDEKGFRFPLYPDDLAKAKNIGFIQVNGQYSEAMPESGEANKGKSITVNMEVCYYFKKPKLPGGGKCMFNTPAGQIDITFDDGGNPEIVDSGQVVDVADAIENLTNQIIDSPPEGSQSTAAPDPHEAEIKREQAERARRVQKQEVQQSGDKETHGTIEDFVQYMEDQGETTFGPGDRQKLLNNLYRT